MAIKRQFDISGYLKNDEPKRNHDIIVGLSDDDCIFFTITDISSGSAIYYSVEFNAKWIPESSIEWFAGVLGRQIYELFIKAQDHKREQIREKFTEFQDALKFTIYP